MKTAVLILVYFLISSLSMALANEGQSLFETKCGTCHALKTALKKTKDLKGWEKTTLKMAEYSEGEISEDEAKIIAKYLSERPSASVDLKKTSKEAANKEDKNHTDNKNTEHHHIYDFKQVRVDQFISPEVCKGCHSEIFDQWSGSMHSKAFVDPVWRAATKLFVKDVTQEGEIMEMKACVKCHTPLGFRSKSISSPEDDYDKLAALPAQGIFCNWCHNINEVKHLGDAGYEVNPDGINDEPSTMLGPFKDSVSPFHPTKYSKLHTTSEFCGLCHNVSHSANNLPIEQTYDEWKNSPYNTGDPKTTVHCQDCHMRQKPGVPATGKTERPDNPGKACDSGHERDHIWTHYFVGANAVVAKILGNNIHSNMAIERLQHAADLKILKSTSYIKNQLSRINISVINSGAGHYLPTGLTEVRQMWLDVNITDAKGNVLLKSGQLNGKKEIDQHAVVFHTQLGNKHGEIELNVAKADRVLYDHRIPPKGYRIERYDFFIPKEAVSPLTIEAVLKYRSASQSLANILLGDKAPEITVINMAGITEEIDISDLKK